jgi:predicted dehydrogenase
VIQSPAVSAAATRDARPDPARGVARPHSGADARLRIGVVGGGLIAQLVHLPSLRELDARFELVALAEPDRRVRERLAARHAIARAYADHRALLDAGGLDAVLVCAPNGLHEAVTLDALDAGVHVLVEKPLCLSPEAADRIVARREATGLVVQVGYMKRFDPAYGALCARLGGERPALRSVDTFTVDPGLRRLFGPPGLVGGEGGRRDAALAAATARQVAEATGSEDPADVRPFCDAFLGALVHDVNLVHGLLDALDADGEPEILDAAASPAGDHAGGMVLLLGGARWTMAWSLVPAAGTFSEELRVLSSAGLAALRFPAPYVRRCPARLDGVRPPGSAYADAYLAELEHFHACVTAGASCAAPPEQARRDIELLTRLYRAHLDSRVHA